MKRITEFTFYNFEAVLDSLKFPEKKHNEKEINYYCMRLIIGRIFTIGDPKST